MFEPENVEIKPSVSRGRNIVGCCAYFAKIGLKDTVNLVDVCPLGVDDHVSDSLDVSPIGTVPGAQRRSL